MGSLLRLNRYPTILGLVAALVLLYLAGSATQPVWTFYTILKFSWTGKLVGYSLGVAGICTALVQGGLVRGALPSLGTLRATVLGPLSYALVLCCLRWPARAG